MKCIVYKYIVYNYNELKSLNNIYLISAHNEEYFAARNLAIIFSSLGVLKAVLII